MSIERRERAGIGITGIDIGWLLKVPNFVGPRPAFAGFERDRLRRFGGDRKVAHRKAVMGRFVVAGPLHWLGWLSTAAMALSVLAMVVGFFL